MSGMSRREVSARTPSSAMLVQMLFVVGAVGTGVGSALVTWLGPRAKSDSVEPPRKDDHAD